jgi:glutamate N-acetyltransferase/amino-acid N-acetyltransferase
LQAGSLRSPEMKSHAQHFKKIGGSICAPRGFKAAAVFCDIKKLGTGKGSEKGRKRDLALIVSDVPASVAGMFTTNQVCAAPVKVSAKHAAQKTARAIVANSGNANACTGKLGLRDAKAMTRITATCLASASMTSAEKLDRFKRSSLVTARISADDVLVCSTGRIGVPMPMKNVEHGIVAAVRSLRSTSSAALQTAEAIMTSDTCRKEIAVEFNIGRSTVRIGGICKGAGMIQPGMSRTLHATMLAFITSDVAIESSLLKRALEVAVDQSFNRITVDGDMSTNDSVIMLANGLAGNRKLVSRQSSLAVFQSALNFVTLELAKMIVRDGEGVSRFITLHIHGAKSARDAEAAARSIANSQLVRTSWCGGDPNWGRVLCALGYSNATVNESIVDVGYAKPGSRKIIFGFRRGQPTNVSIQTLARISSAPEFDLHIDLNLARHDFVLYTSDLTEDYVAFNKGDVSDPKSLGG